MGWWQVGQKCNLTSYFQILCKLGPQDISMSSYFVVDSLLDFLSLLVVTWGCWGSAAPPGWQAISALPRFALSANTVSKAQRSYQETDEVQETIGVEVSSSWTCLLSLRAEGALPKMLQKAPLQATHACFCLDRMQGDGIRVPHPQVRPLWEHPAATSASLAGSWWFGGGSEMIWWRYPWRDRQASTSVVSSRPDAAGAHAGRVYYWATLWQSFWSNSSLWIWIWTHHKCVNGLISSYFFGITNTCSLRTSKKLVSTHSWNGFICGKIILSSGLVMSAGRTSMKESCKQLNLNNEDDIFKIDPSVIPCVVAGSLMHAEGFWEHFELLTTKIKQEKQDWIWYNL